MHLGKSMIDLLRMDQELNIFKWTSTNHCSYSFLGSQPQFTMIPLVLTATILAIMRHDWSSLFVVLTCLSSRNSYFTETAWLAMFHASNYFALGAVRIANFDWQTAEMGIFTYVHCFFKASLSPFRGCLELINHDYSQIPWFALLGNVAKPDVSWMHKRSTGTLATSKYPLDTRWNIGLYEGVVDNTFTLWRSMIKVSRYIRIPLQDTCCYLMIRVIKSSTPAKLYILDYFNKGSTKTHTTTW